MNNIEIFDGIKDASKKRLIEIGKLKKLAKKEMLFNEKDIVDKVYIIKNGKVSIFKINESGERKIIFILGRGDLVNDILIDRDRTSIVGCEAFDEAELVEYDSKVFIDIMEHDFELTKNVILHYQNRSRRLYRQLKNSISIRMDKKLAAKLYRIGKEFGIDEGEWTFLNIDLTITYIADMLGCKRETLSRAMKVLQDKKLVKIQGKKFYIKQEELSKYFKSN